MPGYLSLGDHSAEDRAVARSSPAPGTNFQYCKNDNILIQDIPMISDFLMKSKKSKTSKSEKTAKKSLKKKSKKSLDSTDDSGIVLIDDDLEVDTEKELEERKAYLEEARSQDSGD